MYLSTKLPKNVLINTTLQKLISPLYGSPESDQNFALGGRNTEDSIRK